MQGISFGARILQSEWFCPQAGTHENHLPPKIQIFDSLISSKTHNKNNLKKSFYVPIGK
jgi:hypothetical protein